MNALTAIRLNGQRSSLLPHVLNVTFQGHRGVDMLKKLSPYVAAASGSACSSLISKPSHVLMAMGLTSEEAMSSIRFSLGKLTTELEIQRALQSIQRIWNS